MRSIPFSIILFARLVFISGSSCRIGVLFLFSMVLIFEQFAYGSYPLDKENTGGSYLKSRLQMPNYDSRRNNDRNRGTITLNQNYRPWAWLYAQNTQSEDYELRTSVYELQAGANAPTATTSSASNVSYNSATLQGTVNAHGLSTTVWFQYRIVNGPSKNTFSIQTVIGASDTEVNIGVIALLPGTTYYYRIVARNDAGTTYGSEMSFTTTDMHAHLTTEITPPTGSININNGAYCANSLTVTANLSATDNTGVTGYYLSADATPPSRYTTGWTSTTPTLNYKEDVSYTLSDGDGRNTVYAWFKDASGNISDTASASVVVDTTPPTITIADPTSDQTYTTTSGTISISGSASDDINEITSIVWINNEERSKTERKTIGWTIPNIDLVKGDNVITVTAADSMGNAGTTTITITYAEANNSPAVTTGPATSITTDMATLSGVVNAMGLPTTAWFQYGTSSEHYSGVSSIQNIEDVLRDVPVSDRISGLQTGTAYYYRLAAQNSDGISYGDEMTFDTLPPKGRIYGSVVSFVKGEPAESARLRLKGTKARKKAFKVTFSDANGFFEFEDLDADTYDISAIKADFKSTSQTVALEEGEEKKIDIILRKIKKEDQAGDLKTDQPKATQTPKL
ncbi:MAG: carboxypeptidase regulatory-like domain-containing protein [Candidatus Brocadia sp.]|nr:carboxypeptidase regulatory-like domain-containing protein [Candidatus Brocadia sp.]